MSASVLENTRARRLFLQRHGLIDMPSGSGKGSDLMSVIKDLGFVQIDSVNTFARAHDLILWSRRQQYRPRALELALARDRAVFEHWTHDASTIPIDAFPHWRLRFKRSAERLRHRWAKDRRAGFLDQTEKVLKQISDNGCCTSADVGSEEPKKSGGWWDWHPSKTALEYLWHSGDLSVVRRDGFRKVYDLTERVIPPEQLNSYVDDEASIDWHCSEAIKRLGFATSGEIADFWATVTKAETRAWCDAALADGRIVEIEVVSANGTRRPTYALPNLMDAPTPQPNQRVRILSPFDPALRNRDRAERLFKFTYRIEIFVPEAKRTYGYYVFPVLQGDRMIGRIDMKTSKKSHVLDVRAFWPEQDVRMGAGRVSALKSELDRCARFADCGEVRFASDWLRG